MRRYVVWLILAIALLFLGLVWLLSTSRTPSEEVTDAVPTAAVPTATRSLSTVEPPNSSPEIPADETGAGQGGEPEPLEALAPPPTSAPSLAGSPLPRATPDAEAPAPRPASAPPMAGFPLPRMTPAASPESTPKPPEPGSVDVPVESGSFTADEALRTYGSIAFNAPSQAELEKIHMIQLLLDPSGIPPEVLGENISEPGEVRTATIRISDSVEAKLSGAAFEIRAITPEVQAVSGVEPTEWRWEIVPKERGTHRLFLTINAIIPSSGGDRRRTIRSFDQTITVVVTGTPLQRFWIPASIVLVIAALIVIVFRERRRQRAAVAGAPGMIAFVGDGDSTETDFREGVATVPDASGMRKATDALATGDVIAGRYVVENFLGRGGMGAVYAARDRELGERVAIKTMLPSAMISEASLARFRREIQYARRVAHPNVCRIHDLGQHQPQPGGEILIFVSMEIVEGMTLSALLREKGKLIEADALPIIGQIAAGLDATHRAGLVHRDLKPANIMITEDRRRVVVMDFGLARLTDPAARDVSITETGALVGSPIYMAPEQLEDAEVSPATDVYAFGAVIYEVVTGARPFDSENPLSLIAQRLHGHPIPPSRRTPDISPAWERTILRCLERKPEDRFQSASSVVESLRGSTSDDDVTARMPSAPAPPDTSR